MRVVVVSFLLVLVPSISQAGSDDIINSDRNSVAAESEKAVADLLKYFGSSWGEDFLSYDQSSELNYQYYVQGQKLSDQEFMQLSELTVSLKDMRSQVASECFPSIQSNSKYKTVREKQSCMECEKVFLNPKSFLKHKNFCSGKKPGVSARSHSDRKAKNNRGYQRTHNNSKVINIKNYQRSHSYPKDGTSLTDEDMIHSAAGILVALKNALNRFT